MQATTRERMLASGDAHCWHQVMPTHDKIPFKHLTDQDMAMHVHVHARRCRLHSYTFYLFQCGSASKHYHVHKLAAYLQNTTLHITLSSPILPHPPLPPPHSHTMSSFSSRQWACPAHCSLPPQSSACWHVQTTNWALLFHGKWGGVRGEG